MTEYCCVRKPCPTKDFWYYSDLAISGQSSLNFLAIHAGGDTKYAQEDAEGGGGTTTIRKGKPFAGRVQGGGERGQIFGTGEYGSGYPGNLGRGVSGRGFPFYFWPVVWNGNAAGNGDAYLYASSEYSPPSNSERPGGFLATTTFVSSAVGGGTYRILTDNATAAYLIPQIVASCVSFLNLSSITPTAYPSSVLPSPEQALQYYRATSIVLTLDGYNNTPISGPHTLSGVSNISDPALGCLNSAIGREALLVDKYGPTNEFIGFLRFVAFLIFILISLYIGIVTVIMVICYAFDYLSNLFYHKKNPEGPDGVPLLPRTDFTASPAIAMSSIHSPAVSTFQGADMNVYRSHTGVRRDEDAQSYCSWDTAPGVAGCSQTNTVLPHILFATITVSHRSLLANISCAYRPLFANIPLIHRNIVDTC